MKLDKKFIFWFNKNKSKEEYTKILDEYFSDVGKCRCCNGIIYYYDSTFKISKFGKNLELHKKSYLTTKKLDKEYRLSVCEDCLNKEFPEYQEKNKSRVFNQMNKITEYAFNIDPDVALSWMKDNYAITENNLIKKWGEIDGRKRWKKYCDKQALTNTFEYKQEKYGWTKDQFDEYNKSRSVTIENLVNRHGEKEGNLIWEKYCDRQRYTTTPEYFIEEYGKKEGNKKYNNYCEQRMSNSGYSKISQEIFDKVNDRINETAIYATKGGEVSIEYTNENETFRYYIDCYIKELNIGIEFNGDLWHANPNKFKSDDKFPFGKQQTSQDIWNKDKDKIDFLKTKLDKLIIIWEMDLKKDGMEITVNKILSEIYG